MYLFGSAITNKPEGLLDAQFTKRGRIEHHFYAMDTVSIVFIEVKKLYVLGRSRLDVIAQALAESLGMPDFPNFDDTANNIILASDYVNSKVQLWVPILAIICDGSTFEFLVLDSGNKSVYSSGVTTGVVDVRKRPQFLMPTLKDSKVGQSSSSFQY